ncbi:MAG: NlpC/P60 family protein [Actinomycetota bacterium]|nr:NlpC/P60 family protein [Actinomycetota bacterium]
MSQGGTSLRRRLTTIALCSALGATLLPVAMPTAATAGIRTGAQTAIVFNDLSSEYNWAKLAINFVGGTNRWMRDYPKAGNGTYQFKPGALETRILLARAAVEAFAPTEAVDTSITFTDLDASAPLYPYANVAVKLGWMSAGPKGAFSGDGPVTTILLHKVLVLALGLMDTAAAIDHLHMANGTAFATPANLGTTLLGMRIGLRYNNSDEAKDVLPKTKLPRAQVAYSLYRAATLDSWVVPYLQAQYDDMRLPNLKPVRREIVEWGLKYVGYPYLWGGEWGFKSAEPSALGGQPIPGFDCSGLTWWAMRADDGGAWNVAPPRPYAGWSLPQRASADMATVGNVSFKDLRPGDLMFYDGDGNGVVDHVDTFLGNGWALDSAGSVGGVTIMWVGDGWYRDHFVHGRHLG